MDFAARIIVGVFVLISLFALSATSIGGPSKAIEKQLKK